MTAGNRSGRATAGKFSREFWLRQQIYCEPAVNTLEIAETPSQEREEPHCHLVSTTVPNPLHTPRPRATFSLTRRSTLRTRASRSSNFHPTHAHAMYYLLLFSTFSPLAISPPRGQDRIYIPPKNPENLRPADKRARLGPPLEARPTRSDTSWPVPSFPSRVHLRFGNFLPAFDFKYQTQPRLRFLRFLPSHTTAPKFRPTPLPSRFC
jgi:hypothetical protein